MALNIVKKIRVEGVEHSKRVQDALFDEGYFWSNNGIREHKYTNMACLFAEVSANGKLYLLYSDGVDFDDHACDEFFLVGGKLSSTKKVDVRPVEEIHALHKAIDVERFKELHKAIAAHLDLDEEMPLSL